MISVVLMASPIYSCWMDVIVSSLDKHQGFWLVVLTFGLLATAIITCVRTVLNDNQRTRPYVILEVVPWHFMGVKLSNIGLTPAKNVRIVSNPQIRMSFRNYKKDINFILKGVPYLPPRSSHETHIGTIRELKEVNPSLIYSGQIHYESGDGRRFKEDFILDYSLYEDVTDAPEDTVTKALKELKQEFHLFCSGFYKLHVLTEDYDAYEAKVEKAMEEQMLANKTKSSSVTENEEA